jgi:hypothetical protein
MSGIILHDLYPPNEVKKNIYMGWGVYLVKRTPTLPNPRTNKENNHAQTRENRHLPFYFRQ